MAEIAYTNTGKNIDKRPFGRDSYVKGMVQVGGTRIAAGNSWNTHNNAYLMFIDGKKTYEDCHSTFTSAVELSYSCMYLNLHPHTDIPYIKWDRHQTEYTYQNLHTPYPHFQWCIFPEMRVFMQANNDKCGRIVEGWQFIGHEKFLVLLEYYNDLADLEGKKEREVIRMKASAREKSQPVK